jgi:hypothetical protein
MTEIFKILKTKERGILVKNGSTMALHLEVAQEDGDKGSYILNGITRTSIILQDGTELDYTIVGDTTDTEFKHLVFE